MVSANPRRSARAPRRPSAAAAAHPPADPRSDSRRLPSARRPRSAAAPPRARRSARRLLRAAERSDPRPPRPPAAVSARSRRVRADSAPPPRRAARVLSDRRRRVETPSVRRPPRPREASARRRRARVRLDRRRRARFRLDRRRRARVRSDRRRRARVRSDRRRAGASAGAGSAPPRVSSSRTRRAPRSRRCDGRRETDENRAGGRVVFGWTVANGARRMIGIRSRAPVGRGAIRPRRRPVAVERHFFIDSTRVERRASASFVVVDASSFSATARAVPFRSLHSVETRGKLVYFPSSPGALRSPRSPSRQSQGVLAYCPTAARSSS